MFKRKKEVLPPALTMEEAIAAEVKKKEEINIRASSIDWVRSSPNSLFSEIFSSLISDVAFLGGDNPDSLPELSRVAYYAAVHKLDSISRTWFQIDRHIVSDTQAVAMFNCLNIYLANTVSKFITISHSHSMHYAYDNYVTYDSPSLIVEFSKNFATLYDIKVSQEKKIRSIGIPENNKVAGSPYSFPKINTPNKKLQVALTNLEDLWATASSKKNSVEDEYILEETVTNYLPAAFRLYSTFKVANTEYQRKAENIILEQVSLLEIRVQAIMNSSFEAALLSLAAQTEFLKTKTVEEPEVVETFRFGAIT